VWARLETAHKGVRGVNVAGSNTVRNVALGAVLMAALAVPRIAPSVRECDAWESAVVLKAHQRVHRRTFAPSSCTKRFVLTSTKLIVHNPTR
jgi:hypothetical protein